MSVVNKDGVLFTVGERYNWKNQYERLIYMGVKSYPGNGWWHQFALVEKPNVCWSEVRENDLDMFERTQPEPPKEKVLATGVLGIKSMDGFGPVSQEEVQSAVSNEVGDTELVTLHLPANVVVMFKEIAIKLGVANYQTVMEANLINHCYLHNR